MLRVQSSNLNAFAGEDYDVVDEIMTFQPNDTQKSFFVTIHQDARVEDNERFTLLLTTDDDGVTIRYNTTTITITDDDGEYNQRLLWSYTSNSEMRNRLARFGNSL